MSSDSLTVKCPFCGKASRMPLGASGRVVRCPHCQQTWRLPGEPQQVQATKQSGQSPQPAQTAMAGMSPAEKAPSGVFVDASRIQGVPATSEIGVHPSMAAGTAMVSPSGGGPTSSIWWFVLGGLSVLVLLGVLAAVVVVVVLFLQKTPQPLPQPPAIVAEPTPPAPDPAEELNRKGAATAAFLEALFNETRKVLGDFSNSSNLFAGGAPAPGDLDRKMAAWEQAMTRLNTEDVDPVAIQFKENYAREFKKFLSVIIKQSQSQSLNAALQSGNPDAVLNMADQLAAAQSESLQATNNFFDFLNTEGQAVKKDLESRYHRTFPMPSLPR